jgi:type 1 glutamine amidotransferase
MKLVMISGSFEYDSEKSLSLFKDYLKKNHDIESTLIVYTSEDAHPSLKPVEKADVLLVFTRRINESGRELERFKAYCAQGRPIVGVRTASHAYQNWLDFDKEVLGGNYDGHYGPGPLCRVEIETQAVSHPIVAGITPFVSGAHLYKNNPIAPDAFVLMTGHSEDHVDPVAWTRMHHGGRIFYTSLGNQADFTLPAFLRMLSQAVVWANGK